MILNLSATVEASVDFSEDVGSIDEEEIKDRVKELVNSVELHMDDSNAGERLRDGVQVCILGKPNVGKSTLLNTLCRRPAAIVSPIAGTTRDTIEQYLDVGGFPIKIVDTAGIRDANEADTIELEGIKRAENVAQSSDLIIIVVDSSEIPTNAEIHEWCRKSEQNLTLKSNRTAMKILVLNKCDLLSNTDFEYTKERLVDIENIILMSCVTGEGFDQFINILRDSVQNLCLRDKGTSFCLIIYQVLMESLQESLNNHTYYISICRISAEWCMFDETKTPIPSRQGTSTLEKLSKRHGRGIFTIRNSSTLLVKCIQRVWVADRKNHS